MEVFMNDPEFSDTEIPLLMTGHKSFLQADYNNGRRILCSQN
jgi:hypothetical protein